MRRCINPDKKCSLTKTIKPNRFTFISAKRKTFSNLSNSFRNAGWFSLWKQSTKALINWLSSALTLAPLTTQLTGNNIHRKPLNFFYLNISKVNHNSISAIFFHFPFLLVLPLIFHFPFCGKGVYYQRSSVNLYCCIFNHPLGIFSRR